MKFNHIVSNPGILNGKPCIKGTRISVQIILEWIASGASVKDIATKYSHLSEEGVIEAIQYAAKFMDNEIIIETTLTA